MSVRSSVHKSKPSSPDPENIDKLDRASPIKNVFISSRELRSQTKCSRSTDALISPRQNLTASISSVLLKSDSSDTKINQNESLSLEGQNNIYLETPPENVRIRRTRSLSKILKGPNTPSPEKRTAESGSAFTPTKRLKRTPDSHSGDSETYRSKLRSTADLQTLRKSPVDIQAQEIGTSEQKDEESESLTESAMSCTEKKNVTKSSCGVSKTTNDACKSNLLTSNSTAIIVSKSAKDIQTQGSKIDDHNAEESEPDPEENTICPRGNLSADLHSPVNLSNSNIVGVTKKVYNLSSNEEESTINSIVSKDTSSTTLNFKPGKQNDKLPTKEPLTVLHLPTTADSCSCSTNKNSEERNESLSISDDQFESLQPPLQELLPESTDDASGLNLQLPTGTQKSITKDDESYVKTQNFSSVNFKETLSASNARCSIIKTERPKCSNSKRLILNPHLPATPSNIFDSGIETKGMKPRISPKIFNPHSLSSCHSPRPSSIINIPRRILTFESSDNMAKVDESQSNSSTLTTLESKESRQDLKESTSRNQKSLRESETNETLTLRNPPLIDSKCDAADSTTKSQPRKTSRNLSELTKDFNRAICIVKPQFRLLLSSIASNMNLPPRNQLEFWTQSDPYNQSLMMPSVNLPSNHQPISRNSSESQSQRNHNGEVSTILNRSMVGKSVINPPYIVYDEDSSSPRHSNAVIDDNPPYIDVYKGEASRSNNQPENTNHNPPYIDVYEGEASTSRHQPVITDFDSAYKDVLEEESSTSMDQSLPGDLSTLRHQSLTGESSTSRHQSLPDESSTSRHQSLPDESSASKQQSVPDESSASKQQSLPDESSASRQQSLSYEAFVSRIQSLLCEASKLRHQPLQRASTSRHQPLGESSTSRHQPLGEVSTSRHQPLLDKAFASTHQHLLDEASTSSHQHLLDEASTSSHQHLLNEASTLSHQHLLDEASTSRHQHLLDESSTLTHQAQFGEVSTSSHQPLLGEASSKRLQPLGVASILRHQPFNIDESYTELVSSLSRNRTTGNEINPQYMDVLEEESNQTLSTDDSFFDTSEDSESVENHVSTEVRTSSRADWLPGYVSDAHLILQSIIREMMLYYGDHEDWEDIAVLFRRLSQSSSYRTRRALNWDLLSYYGKVIIRSGNFPNRNQSMSIGLFLRNTFEGLIQTVIFTLQSTLAVYSSLNSDELFSLYETFRREYAGYWRFWENNDIEDIENEASKFQLKSLKKIIQRHLLMTLTAFRLLLMYIGENAKESRLEFYEENLADEDKMYLRRDRC